MSTPNVVCPRCDTPLAARWLTQDDAEPSASSSKDVNKLTADEVMDRLRSRTQGEDVEALDQMVRDFHAEAITHAMQPLKPTDVQFWAAEWPRAIRAGLLAALRSRPVEPEPVAYTGYCDDRDCDAVPSLVHQHHAQRIECECGQLIRWHPLYASPVAPAWRPIEKDVEALDTRVAYAIAMCLSPESEYGGKFWRCAACGAIIDNTDESEEHAENCPVTVLTALRSRPVEPEPVAWPHSPLPWVQEEGHPLTIGTAKPWYPRQVYDIVAVLEGGGGYCYTGEHNAKAEANARLIVEAVNRFYRDRQSNRGRARIVDELDAFASRLDRVVDGVASPDAALLRKVIAMLREPTSWDASVEQIHRELAGEAPLPPVEPEGDER